MTARLLLNIQVPDHEANAYTSLAYLGPRDVLVAGRSERYHVYERLPGEPWARVRLEADRLAANFQGNPLWPRQILRQHPTLTHHFGLCGESEGRVCLIPDVSLINMRLAELEGLGAGDRPSFGFLPVADYPVDADGRIADETYVMRFVEEGVLPFDSVDRRDCIHDWSYHFPTMLFHRFLSHMRANLQWAIDHSAYETDDGRAAPSQQEWNYFGHSLDEAGRFRSMLIPERLSRRAALFRQLAIGLDSNCAKIVQFLKVGLDGQSANFSRAAALFNAFLSPPSPASMRQIAPRESGMLTAMATGHPSNGDAPAIDLFVLLDRLLVEREDEARARLDRAVLAERRHRIGQVLANLTREGTYA